MSIQECALGGFLAIGIGLLLLLFRKPFARFVIASQNKWWGSHLDEKVEARSAVSVPGRGGNSGWTSGVEIPVT